MGSQIRGNQEDTIHTYTEARTVLNGKKKLKNLVPYKKTQNLGTEMELELQLTAVGLQPTAVGL